MEISKLSQSELNEIDKYQNKLRGFRDGTDEDLENENTIETCSRRESQTKA